MPPPHARTRSLTRRLLAAFLAVGLLPLGAALLLSSWTTRGVVADLLEANVSTTARLYASEVDDFLAQKTAMLDALAAGVAPENS
ncbi:MAG: hypothetical protein ACI8PZ_006270, partial [Myxococcota bacterium]